ncbi:MAG TPA: DUF2071 domain-containing protein, partial [Rubrobacteraceae bacterium]|nr:DUF2071 domain-containing protein [Rubrobacteraceae bacterium]
YALYATDRHGRLRRGDVHHVMWPLQPAEVEVEKLEMTGQIGLSLPGADPVLHFARRLDVLAWPPERVGP